MASPRLISRFDYRSPMPPVVIDIRSAEDRRDVVHRAVQALVEGELVAFPTETVYGIGASARSSTGVRRLLDAKGSERSAPFALAIKSFEDAVDYVPNLNRLARRLARRCWPGPVTIVVDQADQGGLISQLPDDVRQVVAPQATIGLRVPAHDMILDVLSMLAGPIALTSANRTGDAEATTAADVVAKVGEELAMVLDEGPTRYGQPSSVVRVFEQRYETLREGVVAESTLRRLAGFQVLLVCTGNTCRSPMAEVLMRKHLADRLGCPPAELEEQGVFVTSAGIAAPPGCHPTREAVQVMRERALDLSQHQSQPLTDALVRHADLILTMTRSHRSAIVRQWPEAAARTELVEPNQADVADPIGGTLDIYRDCANQIDTALKSRTQQLEI